MPLRAHFHAPLSRSRSWTSVHGGWAFCISELLNERLPTGWFAEPLADFGIEVDVAALDVRRNGSPPSVATGSGWTSAPTATLTMRGITTDEVGVRIYAGGPQRLLVGSIEIVSPSNKDRDTARELFATKCLRVLRSGAGLIVVDIVASRHPNLHREILERGGGPQETPFEADLYAVAYRPLLPVPVEVRPDDDVPEAEPARIETWVETLAVGRTLPTLPLWLLGCDPIGVDLEAAYQLNLRRLRYDP